MKKRKRIEKEPPIQIFYAEKANQQTLEWANELQIKLYTIQILAPFILSDKSLDVYLFYETDDLKNIYKEDGTEEKIKDYYLKSLEKLEYPHDYLQCVTFFSNSHENVVKNYEGSYFYFMR